MVRRLNTTKVAPTAAANVDTSKWLDDDFAGVKIKNFDEMRENFIEDLTNQFSDLLMPVARERQTSVKVLPTTGMSLTEPDA